MSKPNDVAVLTSGNGTGAVITSLIRSSKEDKIAAYVVPNGFAGFGATLGVILSITTGNSEPMLGLLATMGALSIGGTSFLLHFGKLSAIVNHFNTRSDDNSLGFKTRRAARKGRVYINSFSIRENVNTEIKAWQDPNNSVPSNEATHTVKQYLRKAKKGFMVEQEVVPNSETIWDISAEAMVEVYSIQENKTKELSQ